ncbi:MAG: hypothetical protein N4A65_15630 [Cohaesibacter sp.]|jgi:hypothetical protein|nr:hypothetical protein [Cohaesibacter sp.]
MNMRHGLSPTLLRLRAIKGNFFLDLWNIGEEARQGGGRSGNLLDGFWQFEYWTGWDWAFRQNVGVRKVSFTDISSAATKGKQIEA